jgi:hypothetical protein
MGKKTEHCLVDQIIETCQEISCCLASPSSSHYAWHGSNFPTRVVVMSNSQGVRWDEIGERPVWECIVYEPAEED